MYEEIFEFPFLHLIKVRVGDAESLDLLIQRVETVLGDLRHYRRKGYEIQDRVQEGTVVLELVNKED